MITLSSEAGIPELIVCGVPFLRDRDVRKSLAGESIEDKAKNLVEGIRRHYEQVLDIATIKRDAIGKERLSCNSCISLYCVSE